MKKLYAILIICCSLIAGILVFVKYLILGKEVDIILITEQYKSQTNTSGWDINNNEWIIISNENQLKNVEEDGFSVPHIDFNRNYLIMSKYKISKLYRKIYTNKCSGVPNGHIFFDKENSDNDSYYFYLMPKIMLSQGVG